MKWIILTALATYVGWRRWERGNERYYLAPRDYDEPACYFDDEPSLS